MSEMRWSSGSRLLRRFGHRLLNLSSSPGDQNDRITPADQIMLALGYRRDYEKRSLPLNFREIGFRAFSQTDEDGILLYLLALTGMPTRRSVEICSGDGIECNSANLIINHGYYGLLVDGLSENVQSAQSFYRRHPDTRIFPPVSLHAWITRGNVNEIIRNAGFQGEIDVLSLDLDGIDYWIWKEITVVNPRVVVVEYQTAWADERAVTVPYSDDFRAVWFDGNPDYAGASLPAFAKLGAEKGYRLVGCNRYCYNAFFLRNDVGPDVFKTISPSDCFSHPFVQYRREERLAHAKKYAWVEV